MDNDILSQIKINDRNLKIHQKGVGYWVNVLSCQDSARYVLENFPANHRVFRLVSDNLDYAIGQYTGGRIIEFGVASGASINHIAGQTDALVDGFDSFEGCQKIEIETSGKVPPHKIFRRLETT